MAGQVELSCMCINGAECSLSRASEWREDMMDVDGSWLRQLVTRYISGLERHTISSLIEGARVMVRCVDVD